MGHQEMNGRSVDSKLRKVINAHKLRMQAQRRPSMEPLESRRLLTVAAVAGFTPPAVTGAPGSTGIVELTRYADDTAATSHTVQMAFPTGTVNIQTFDTEVPHNVANFLRYVRGGPDGKGYNNSIFQRFDPNFVLQGGSLYADGTPVITTGQPAVTDEVPANTGRSNTRGTLAFARGDNDPNSASSGFFFNLADNGANLNNQNGGFDVFGQITSGTVGGVAVSDAVSIVDNLGGLATVRRVVNDAVVLEPTVTFHAVSDNPANVSVIDPATSDGKLQLQYNGPIGSAANIAVTATQAGQVTPVTLNFTATVTQGPFSVSIGGATGNKAVTYTDADGTVSTISIKGPGTAVVAFSGTTLSQTASKGKVSVAGNTSATSISVTGSTASTSVSMGGRGGDAKTTLGSVTIDGAAKSFSAAATSLAGTFTTGDALASLVLGAVSSSGITIGGTSASRSTSIVLGAVSDTQITSGPPIKSFRSASFATGGNVTNSIAAPSISSLANSGDFDSDLTVAGAIKSIKVNGNFASSLQADSLGALTVGGNMDGTGLRLSQPYNARAKAVGSVKIVGAMHQSFISSKGNVGSVYAGSMNVAQIFAGVSTVVFPTDASQFVDPAIVSSVKVGTTSFAPFLAASRFQKVALGAVTIENAGQMTGLAAQTIDALTFKVGTAAESLKHLNVPADFTTQLQARTPGLDLKDFGVMLF